MALEATTWNTSTGRLQFRLSLGLAVGWGVLAAAQIAFTSFESWKDAFPVVIAVVLSLVYVFAVWAEARHRVEADTEELRIVTGLRHRPISWSGVADIRNDTKPPWGTCTVAELTSGETVRLPLPADHQGIRQFWSDVRSDQ